MAFKLKPPYKIDNTPVYYVKEEDGVLGRANLCGSIIINDKVRDPKLIKEIIKHEGQHVKDIKNGLLWYDDKNVYYRNNANKPFKKYSKEYNKKSPWEKRAYKNEKK